MKINEIQNSKTTGKKPMKQKASFFEINKIIKPLSSKTDHGEEKKRHTLPILQMTLVTSLYILQQRKIRECYK